MSSIIKTFVLIFTMITLSACGRMGELEPVKPNQAMLDNVSTSVYPV